MFYEVSFYLNHLSTPESIMDFAASFGKKLDWMVITDAELRSRSWRPAANRIETAFAAEYVPTHIYLYLREKNGNNNSPRFNLEWMRNSMPEAPVKDMIIALVTNIPIENKAEIAKDWWRLAAGLGAATGNGYFLKPGARREINYGAFGAMSYFENKPIWMKLFRSSERFSRQKSSFLPVARGKMLRNVLRYNFMPPELAEEIESGLKKSGLPVEGFESQPTGHVVWTVPDLELQKAAHKALLALGLVWELDWMDLESYEAG